jgi:hypothetical protein
VPLRSQEGGHPRQAVLVSALGLLPLDRFLLDGDWRTQGRGGGRRRSSRSHPAGRLSDQGQYVVKDPRARTYYHLGEEEHFLLTRLDGQRDGEAIRTAFADRIGQPLSEVELDDFLDMARTQGFLQPARGRREPFQGLLTLIVSALLPASSAAAQPGLRRHQRGSVRFTWS